MQLHNLPFAYKKEKRVGRGGKRGTTAGRGTKGQKSRSGRRLRPAERDLLLRLPKKRGFRNKPKPNKDKVFNIGRLAEIFVRRSPGGALTIDRDLLIEAGLLSARFKGDVKILGKLGKEDPKIKLTFKGLKLSKSVTAKHK